jgi:hypothetical protein
LDSLETDDDDEDDEEPGHEVDCTNEWRCWCLLFSLAGLSSLPISIAFHGR